MLFPRRIARFALAACLTVVAAAAQDQPSLEQRLTQTRQAVETSPEDVQAWQDRAEALHAAGVNEAARDAARRAVQLAPDSASAQRILGLTLAADAVSRPFLGDFDSAGAEQALRRAVELDPADTQARFLLAQVLERDRSGWLYSPEARTGEAIQQYAHLVSNGGGPEAVQKLIDAMFRDRRYEEIKDLLARIGPERDPMMQIAVLAAVDGPPAAISWATGNLPAEDQRAGLVQAASRLTQVRAYKPASALYAAASRGSVEAQRLMNQAALLERIVPHTNATHVEGPAGPGFDALIDVYRNLPVEQLHRHRSRHAQRLLANPAYIAQYEQAMERIRESIRLAGASPDVTLDIAMATRQAQVEGESGLGYRVKARVSGRESTFFVIEEDGRYKLLDVVSRPGEQMADLAREVLARVENGRVDRARMLLEWAYEMRQASERQTDDPLSGSIFARFWEPDAVVGIDEVRWAAASLLAENEYDAADAVEILRPAYDAVQKPKDRVRFALALAAAYTRLERDQELLDVALPLYEQHPKSNVAYTFVALALMHLERFDNLTAHLDQRLAKNPSEPLALRMRMQAAVQRADIQAAKSTADAILQARSLGPAELNNVAWAALAAGQVDQEAVSAIEKAMQMTEKRPNKDLLNTAAAVFAEAGRLEDARKALLESMRIAGMIEPDSNSWYVFGRIAEQYGELAAARPMYERVERPSRDSELPGSPYRLAQDRLAVIAQSEAAAQ